jgi:hypothetical protein
MVGTAVVTAGVMRGAQAEKGLNSRFGNLFGVHNGCSTNPAKGHCSPA